MSRYSNIENFISKSVSLYGDKYTYENAVYKSVSTKLVITCPIHGDFSITPKLHFNPKRAPNSCPSCRKEATRKKSFDLFLSKSVSIHKNKYDYSKFVYINSSIKSTITCPIHGDFKQSSHKHLEGRGCPKCGHKIKTSEQYISKLTKIHKGKYQYIGTVDNSKPVNAVCKIHGEFSKTLSCHLRGHGCPKCGNESIGNKLSSNTEEFVKKATNVHNGRYSYTKVNYTNNTTPVTITCPVHGDFEQIPSNHLRGKGCGSCAKGGFDYKKPGYLYYLKVTTQDNTELFKIGITNKSVKQRFSVNELSKIEVIKLKKFNVGKDAYKIEQQIIEEGKAYKYTGPSILESGNTELFTVDVSKLLDVFKIFV